MATNAIMKNFPQLSKVFNEEGYKLEAAVDSSLVQAIQTLATAGKSQTDTAKYSSIYHNMGVTIHMRGELEKAAEAYKEALRKNPADEDARYNLAVILHQMKNNQNQQNQQQEQQEEKPEEEQEQQQQQQQEENKEQEQKEQEEQQQNNDEQQQQQQQQQSASEEENDKEKMEQMLKALLQDEKEIREKMEELEKAKSKSRSIEKNW
jgi:Ca-activated chloride channel family protein